MTQQPLMPHRVIAARTRELRKKRGWSAAHLAVELKRVGLPWDRSIVASFELGRRATVTVEELLALAYVFSVAPVHLMVPPTVDVDPYRVAPGAPLVPADTVREWIRGREALGDPRIFASEVPAREVDPDRAGQVPHVQFVADLARLNDAARHVEALRAAGKTPDEIEAALHEMVADARRADRGER